ncbi:DUF6585 family protein [Dactylosporangium sp. CA-233914]|uniref:DUF6585 family protein n=1 Tax=Dactylosporangium sp. CA-233914 TaxID=3239934 RepID=UPI003D92CB12
MTADQLGGLRESYPPNPEPWIGTAFAGAGLAFMVFVTLVSQNWGVGLVTAGLAVTWTVVTASKVRAARRGKGARLDLHEHGLAFTATDGRRFVYRWDSLRMLRRVVESRKNGTVRTWHAYTLAGPEGVAVTLGDTSNGPGPDLGVSEAVRGPSFVRPEQWGRDIEQGVLEAQLPTAVRRIADRQTVAFGPVALHRNGVTAAGRTVPWSQVRHFRIVYNARLEIAIEGQSQPLIRTSVSGIPNFAVLYALGSGLHAEFH